MDFGLLDYQPNESSSYGLSLRDLQPYFAPGLYLDCYDQATSSKKWLYAQILTVDHTARTIYIRWDGYRAQYNETIAFDSDRLAFFNTRAKESERNLPPNADSFNLDQCRAQALDIMTRDNQRRMATTVVNHQATDELALPESQGGLNLSASLSQRLAFSSSSLPSSSLRRQLPSAHTPSPSIADTITSGNNGNGGNNEDYRQSDMKKLAADMRVQYPLRDGLGGLDGTAAKGLMDRSAKLVGGYPPVRTIARTTPFQPVRPKETKPSTTASSSSSAASSTIASSSSTSSDDIVTDAATAAPTPNLLTQMAMANLLALTEDLPADAPPPLSFWKVVDKLLTVIGNNITETGITEFANWCLTVFQSSLPSSLDATIASRIRTTITRILLAQGTPASILRIVQYLLTIDRHGHGHDDTKSASASSSSSTTPATELSSLASVVHTFEENQHVRSKRILRVSWSTHASLLDIAATPLLPVSVTEQQASNSSTKTTTATVAASSSSTASSSSSSSSMVTSQSVSGNTITSVSSTSSVTVATSTESVSVPVSLSSSSSSSSSSSLPSSSESTNGTTTASTASASATASSASSVASSSSSGLLKASRLTGWATKDNALYERLCVDHDGHYLYILSSRFGLVKVGTGDGHTMTGHVYAQNGTLLPHAAGSIAFVHSPLYPGKPTITGSSSNNSVGYLAIRSPYLPESVLRVDPSTLLIVDRMLLSGSQTSVDGDITLPPCSWTLKCDGIPFHEDRLWGDKGPWAGLPLHGWIDAAHRRIEHEILAGNWKFGQTMMLGTNHALIFESNGVWLTKAGQATPTRCELEWTPAPPGQVMCGPVFANGTQLLVVMAKTPKPVPTTKPGSTAPPPAVVTPDDPSIDWWTVPAQCSQPEYRRIPMVATKVIKPLKPLPISRYQVGQNLRARWQTANGNIYDVRVVAVNDTSPPTYHLRYADGDEDRNVPEAHIIDPAASVSAATNTNAPPGLARQPSGVAVAPAHAELGDDEEGDEEELDDLEQALAASVAAPAPVAASVPTGGVLGYQGVEWDCSACTYVNAAARTLCEICNTPRPPPPPPVARVPSIPSVPVTSQSASNTAAAVAAAVVAASTASGSSIAATASALAAALMSAASTAAVSSSSSAASPSSAAESTSSGAATAAAAATVVPASATPSWAVTPPSIAIVTGVLLRSVTLTANSKIADDTVGPMNPEEGDEACDICGCIVHVRCLEPDCVTSLCNYCHQMASFPIRSNGIAHDSSHRVFVGRRMALLKGKRLAAMVRSGALSYIDQRDNTLVLVSRPVATAGNMSPSVVFDLATGQLISRSMVSTLATDLTLATTCSSQVTSLVTPPAETKQEKEGKASDHKRNASLTIPATTATSTTSGASSSPSSHVSQSAVVWGICVDGSLERWRCPDKLPSPQTNTVVTNRRSLALAVLQRLPGLETGVNLLQSLQVILPIVESAITTNDSMVLVASLQLIRRYMHYMLETDGILMAHASLVPLLSSLRTSLLSYVSAANGTSAIKSDDQVARLCVDIIALGFELLWPTWVQRLEYLSELLRTISSPPVTTGSRVWSTRLFSAIVEYYRQQLSGVHPSHHGIPGESELEKNTPESITSPTMKRILESLLHPHTSGNNVLSTTNAGSPSSSLRGSLSSFSTASQVSSSTSALQSLSYVILAYQRQLYLITAQSGVQPAIAAPGKKTHYIAGELIRARWRNGAVYDATVVAVNADGTYSVLYSDGDRDERVPETSITESRGGVNHPPQALPDPATMVYAPGQLVRARWHGGGSYNAVIQAMNQDGTYDVLYEDGDRDRVCPVRNIIEIRGPLLTANSSDRSAAAEVAARAAEAAKQAKLAQEARAALASSALLHTLSEVVAVCLEFFGGVLPSSTINHRARSASSVTSSSVSSLSPLVAVKPVPSSSLLTDESSVGLRTLFHTSCFLLSSLDKKNLPRTVLSQIIESSMSFITRLRSCGDDNNAYMAAFQSELTVVRMLFHRSLESIFEVKPHAAKPVATDAAAAAAAAALAAVTASNAAAAGTASSIASTTSAAAPSTSTTATSSTSSTSVSSEIGSRSSSEIEQQIMARLLPMVLSKKGTTSHIGFLQSFIDSDASLSSLMDEKTSAASSSSTSSSSSVASNGYLNMAPHDFLSAFFALCLREMGGGAAALDLSFSFKSEKAFVAALIRLLSSPPYYSNSDGNPSLLELCQSLAESMTIRILVERSRAARRKVIQQPSCPMWWKSLLAHVFRHIRRPIIDILHGPPVPIASVPAVATATTGVPVTTTNTAASTTATAPSATPTPSDASASAVPSSTPTPAPSEASSASHSPNPSSDNIAAAATAAAPASSSTAGAPSSSTTAVPDIIYLQPAEVAARAADKWAANASFFMNDFHRVRKQQHRAPTPGYTMRPQKLTKKARKTTIPSTSPTGDDKDGKTTLSREAPSVNQYTRASAITAAASTAATGPAQLNMSRSQSSGTTLPIPPLQRARSDPSHDRHIPIEELHGSLNLLADVEWIADFIQQDHAPSLLQQLAQSAVDHRAHAAARLRLLQFFNESMSGGANGEALIDECLPLILRTLSDSEHFHILQPTRALRISSLFGASHRPALTGTRTSDSFATSRGGARFQLGSPSGVSSSSTQRFRGHGSSGADSSGHDEEDVGHGLSDESASVLMTFTKHLVKLLDASFDAAVNVVNQSRAVIASGLTNSSGTTNSSSDASDRRQRIATLQRCEHRIRCILHFFAGDFSSPVDIDVLMRCNVLHILGRFVFHPSLSAQPHLTRMAWNAMLYLIMVATNASHALSDDNRAMLASVSSSLMPALFHRLTTITELPSLQPVCHLPVMRTMAVRSKSGFPANCQEKDFLEACDTGGAWYIGRVLKRDPKKGLFIRYDGWEENYDEWFPFTSTPRLAPLFTRLTTVHPRASERPQALMFSRDEIATFHKSTRFAELAASRPGAAQHIQAALAAARAAGATDLPMSRNHIHPLLLTSDLVGHFCDTCAASCTVAYRCAACNWDQCQPCFDRNKVSVTIAAVSTAVGEPATTPATATATAAPSTTAAATSASSASTSATPATVASTTASGSSSTVTSSSSASVSSSVAATTSSSAASSSTAASSPTLVPLSDKAIEKALAQLMAADKAAAAAQEEERLRDRRESELSCAAAARSNAAVRTAADILRLLPKLGGCSAMDIVRLLPWLTDDLLPSLVKQEMVRWLTTQLVHHSPDHFTDLKTNVAGDLFQLLGSLLLGARFTPPPQPQSSHHASSPPSSSSSSENVNESKSEKRRPDDIAATSDRHDWWLYQSWAVHGDKMADRQRLIAQLVYLIRWFITPVTPANPPSTPSGGSSYSLDDGSNVDVVEDPAELAWRARRHEWSREFTTVMDAQMAKVSETLHALQSIRLREDEIPLKVAKVTDNHGGARASSSPVVVMEQKMEKDHKSSDETKEARERRITFMSDVSRLLATLEVFGGCERSELRQGGLVEIGSHTTNDSTTGVNTRSHARVSSITIGADSIYDAATGIETGVTVEAIPESASGSSSSVSSMNGPSTYSSKDVTPLPDVPAPAIHLYPNTLSRVLEGLRLLGTTAAEASDSYTKQRSARKAAKAVTAKQNVFKHNHPLVPTLGLQRHLCDNCRGSIGVDGIAYRCAFCDYDQCTTCHTRSLAMDAAIAASSATTKGSDDKPSSSSSSSSSTLAPTATTPPAQWLLMMEMHSRMMTIAHSFLTSPLSSSSSSMMVGSESLRLRHELLSLVPSLLKLSQQQHTVRYLMHPNQLVDAAHRHITSLREAEERRAIEDTTIASLIVPRAIRQHILTPIDEDAPVAPAYKAGQKVRAKWHGGAVYDATIQAVNEDGTYDVIYSDGDRDKKTREDWILELLQDVPAAAGGATGATPTGPPRYSVGNHVRAQWRTGQEYNAVVRAVNNDGTYHLRYEDGDEDRNVREVNILRVVAPPMRPVNGYQAGMRVAAKWRGRGRYNATVVAVNNDGTFHLRFEDGDENRQATEDAILELAAGQPNIPVVPVPIQGGTPVPATAGSAAAMTTGTAAATANGTAAAATTTSAPAGPLSGTARRYGIGQPIRARWQGGRVYNADILAVNADGTYHARFEDGDEDRQLREDHIVESRGPAPGSAAARAATVVVPTVKPAILDAVDAIVAMGIPEQQARVALIRHRGDLQRAADLVLQGTELTSPTTWQEFLMSRNEWDTVQAWLNRPPPGTTVAAIEVATPAAAVVQSSPTPTPVAPSSSSSSSSAAASSSSSASAPSTTASVTSTTTPAVSSESVSSVTSSSVSASSSSSIAAAISTVAATASSPPAPAVAVVDGTTAAVTNTASAPSTTPSTAAASSSTPAPAMPPPVVPSTPPVAAAPVVDSALQPAIYVTGDRVIAEWPANHELFSATVVSRNEATNEYHLLYADGDEHPSVAYSLILCRHITSSFNSGAIVHARYNNVGPFLQCVINQVIEDPDSDDGPMYEIMYPDGDIDVVPIGQIFAHPFPPVPRPVRTNVPVTGPLTVGTRVTARWGNQNGTAYGAVITAVNGDGTYQMLYDDGDSAPSVALDRIVSVVTMSNAPATAPTTTPAAGVAGVNPAQQQESSNATPPPVSAAVASGASNGVPAGSPAAKYPIGARLRAKWKGGGDNVYFAVVTAHNRDGTVALKYDDGDVDPACPDSRILEMVTTAPVLDMRAPPGAPHYRHTHMIAERSVEEALRKRKNEQGQRIDHWSPTELIGMTVRLRHNASIQQIALPWPAQFGVIVRVYIDETPIVDQSLPLPSSAVDNKDVSEQKKKADPPRREPVALVQFSSTTGHNGQIPPNIPPTSTANGNNNAAMQSSKSSVVAAASPHYLAWFRITDLVRAERAPHSALGNARSSSRLELLQRSLAAQRQLIGAQATQVLQSVLLLHDSLAATPTDDHASSSSSSSSSSTPPVSLSSSSSLTTDANTASAVVPVPKPLSVSVSSSSSSSLSNPVSSLPLVDLLPCLPNVGSFSLPSSAHALGNFDTSNLTDGIARHASLSYVSSLFLPTPSLSSSSGTGAGGSNGSVVVSRENVAAWNERYRQLRDLINITGDGLARTRMIKYSDQRIQLDDTQIQCSALARFPAGGRGDNITKIGKPADEAAAITSTLALRTSNDNDTAASSSSASSELIMIAFDDSWRAAILKNVRLSFFADQQRLSLLQTMTSPLQRSPLVVPGPVWLDMNKPMAFAPSAILHASLFTTASMEHARFIVDLLLHLDTKSGLDGTQKMMIHHALHAIYNKLVHFLVLLYIAPELRPPKKIVPTPAALAAAAAAAITATIPLVTSTSVAATSSTDASSSATVATSSTSASVTTSSSSESSTAASSASVVASSSSSAAVSSSSASAASTIAPVSGSSPASSSSIVTESVGTITSTPALTTPVASVPSITTPVTTTSAETPAAAAPPSSSSSVAATATTAATAVTSTSATVSSETTPAATTTTTPSATPATAATAAAATSTAAPSATPTAAPMTPAVAPTKTLAEAHAEVMQAVAAITHALGLASSPPLARASSVDVAADGAAATAAAVSKTVSYAHHITGNGIQPMRMKVLALKLLARILLHWYASVPAEIVFAVMANDTNPSSTHGEDHISSWGVAGHIAATKLYEFVAIETGGRHVAERIVIAGEDTGASSYLTVMAEYLIATQLLMQRLTDHGMPKEQQKPGGVNKQASINATTSDKETKEVASNASSTAPVVPRASSVIVGDEKRSDTPATTTTATESKEPVVAATESKLSCAMGKSHRQCDDLCRAWTAHQTMVIAENINLPAQRATKDIATMFASTYQRTMERQQREAAARRDGQPLKPEPVKPAAVASADESRRITDALWLLDCSDASIWSSLLSSSSHLVCVPAQLFPAVATRMTMVDRLLRQTESATRTPPNLQVPGLRRLEETTTATPAPAVAANPAATPAAAATPAQPSTTATPTPVPVAVATPTPAPTSLTGQPSSSGAPSGDANAALVATPPVDDNNNNAPSPSPPVAPSSDAPAATDTPAAPTTTPPVASALPAVAPVLPRETRVRDRHRAEAEAAANGMSFLHYIVKQLLPMDASSLRSPLGQHAWQTRFEGAADMGGIGAPGPFRESMSRIATAIRVAGEQSIMEAPFILCANGVNQKGSNRDRLVFNPQLVSTSHMDMLYCIGMIIGVSLRSTTVLALDLCPHVWKILRHGSTSLTSLIDTNFEAALAELSSFDNHVAQLLSFESLLHPGQPMEQSEFDQLGVHYTTYLSGAAHDIELFAGGRHTRVSFADRFRYARLVLRARFEESEAHVTALRRGLLAVVPNWSSCAALLTWEEIEARICGNPLIDMDVLRAHTTYKGAEANDEVVTNFWKVFAGWSQTERAKWVQFGWGRSRLPGDSSEFGMTLVWKPVNAGELPLPKAQTCYFSVELPKYPTLEMMSKKLGVALYCTDLNGNF